MKYFINEEEREKSNSCYIEFQHGNYDGQVWKKDSICIDEEIFYDLKLKRLFSSVLPQFDYFGITTVDTEAMEKVKAAAAGYLPETIECIEELDSWFKADESGENVYTIIGM